MTRHALFLTTLLATLAGCTRPRCPPACHALQHRRSGGGLDPGRRRAASRRPDGLVARAGGSSA